MAIPDFQALMGPVLDVLSDGNSHGNADSIKAPAERSHEDPRHPTGIQLTSSARPQSRIVTTSADSGAVEDASGWSTRIQAARSGERSSGH